MTLTAQDGAQAFVEVPFPPLVGDLVTHAVRPRTVAFNFIAEGDYVVVEARGDNVTRAGLRYDNQYCMVYRIENGRIREIKEYCDSALVERVLGAFPEERKLTG